MRTPYLVINNKEESFVYTDKRKIKSMFKSSEDITVYMFKTIDRYNYWEDVYRLSKNENETKAEMFKNNGNIYSELGCSIMKSLAKAEWNSSIKYPDNGWRICSVCGRITNEIDECLFCNEFVCWSCSYEVVNSSWIEGRFCSDECFGLYGEEEYGIEYNPEKEYRDSICDRIDRILRNFGKEELFNILIHVESANCDYDEDELDEVKIEYKNKSEDELLDILYHEYSGDVYDALMELYEDDTEDYLSTILDGEAFIHNLDPNDPADEWFFED